MPSCLCYTTVSVYQALEQIMSQLHEAEQKSEPIAVHCSTGQVRTGTVLALWLHNRYHLSLDVAVEECADHARECGATRKATVESLLRLLMGPSQRVLPSMHLAGGAIRCVYLQVDMLPGVCSVVCLNI